jgi:putative thioredoxin
MLHSGGTLTGEEAVKETTTQTFVKDVIEESRRQPVLVDFWAPWCGPCRQLTPVLEKAIRSAKGKAKLVKMNIDDHPGIAQQMGIQSIPAVIAFVNGQPLDGFLGALPESQVTAFIERLIKDRLGGEEKDLLKQAEAAPTGAIEQAKQTLARVPEAKRNETSVAAARAALELAEQATALGPVAELEQKVALNPLDHQARFDLALALNNKGRRLEVLDHLLEIVRRDRKWNDDGARRQLVQLFEAWGPTDEATVAGRRRLSSILFA